MIIIFSLMSFEDHREDLFRSFQTKYGLVPGFQGDFDLRALFGDLVDDPSFVRDRVSITFFTIIVSLYVRSFIFTMYFLVMPSDHGNHGGYLS